MHTTAFSTEGVQTSSPRTARSSLPPHRRHNTDTRRTEVLSWEPVDPSARRYGVNNRNGGSELTMWTDTGLPWDTQTVTLVDILNSTRGDRITVELRGRRVPALVGGDVQWTWTPTSEDPAQDALDEHIVDATDDPRVVLTFDPAVWLEHRDGDVIDQTDRLDEIPAVWPADARPDDDPRYWSVTYDKDGSLRVWHAEAHTDSDGELYFGRVPRGRVTALLRGDLITPQHVKS